MSKDAFDNYLAFAELLEKYGYHLEEIDSFKYDYNEECELNDSDSMIFNMQELDEYFYGYSPSAIVRDTEGGAFNSNDKYFTTTPYGLVSSDYLEDLMDYERLENALRRIGDNQKC